MKKFIEEIKKYFGSDDNITSNIVETIPNAEQKWEALALELNAELQQSRKAHKYVLEECARLQAICECQGELLAERRG
ncbi:hypothetical protein K6V64_05530 [Streptococcus suis]|nr:hypothetical protein [Streptococcus suis]